MASDFSFDRPYPGMSVLAAWQSAIERLRPLLAPSDPLSRASSRFTEQLPTTPLPQQQAPGGPQWRENASLQAIARMILPQTSLDTFLMAVPPAKPVGKVVKAAEKAGAKTAEQEAAERAIRAYHGSPTRHSGKFAAEKLGTGQGAHSFGYGHYFAENPEVAKSYQQTLGSGPNLEVGGKTYKYQSRAALGATSESRAVEALSRFDGDVDEAIKWLDDADIPQDVEAASFLRRNVKGKKFKLVDDATFYEVKLNVEPEALLDWDKPLNEQPEIRKKLVEFVNRAELMPPEVAKGAGVLRRILDEDPRPLGEPLGKVLYERLERFVGKAGTSETLRQAGIPGLRYLDQGSREARTGTRNIVIFPGSEDIIETITINGQPVPKDVVLAILAAGGLQQYQQQQQQQR